MPDKWYSRRNLYRLLKTAWASIRKLELSFLFFRALTLFGVAISLACILLYLVTKIWETQSLINLQNRLSSNSVAVFAALFAAVGFLYTRQRASINNIESSLNSTRTDLKSIVANMDLRVRSGSVFAHCSVIGDDLRLIDEFNLRRHENSAYLSLHSEVLYYSILCSLLEHWKGEINKIWRANAFFPDTPTAMFLPVLLDIVSDLPHECRAYLFRNDVLDYDRQAMRDRRQQHLWPTFAKASRVLFCDQGAKYGFLEPKSPSQSIWHGRETFHQSFGASYERLLIELKNGQAIACIVERDPGTFIFRSARFVASGGDGDKAITETKKYFEELLRDGKWKWADADDWDNHVLEVAIVSGEEMEIQAGQNVTLWAVDDFPTATVPGEPSVPTVQDPKNSWDEPGSSRDIAWRKTVVAALKGSTVNRVFLVEPSIFQSKADLISLFVTMAVQHRFLQQDSISGEARLLVKKEEHKKKKTDQSYPDLAIIVRGTSDVLGGVIVRPEPEYIRLGSDSGKDWLNHVKKMWEDANSDGKFPRCFLAGKEMLANNELEIIDGIAEREKADLGSGTDLNEYKRLLANWFGSQVKLLVDQTV